MDIRNVDDFRSRTPQTDVHPRARMPVSLRAPTPVEASRGIAIAYSIANFTVYRGVTDRLVPGERFRMECGTDAFEVSALEFASAFRQMAATPSYREGTESAPHACYYTISSTSPSQAERFRVKR